eukprot:SAG11_NODE_24924_length_366_cov_0.580524_1_plen_121_part_11
MRAWALYGGCRDVLFHRCDVAISTAPNNAEEYDALEKLWRGDRPDPRELAPLQELLDEMVARDRGDPRSLHESIAAHFGTGSVRKLFRHLDVDNSGRVSLDELTRAAQSFSGKLFKGFQLN